MLKIVQANVQGGALSQLTAETKDFELLAIYLHLTSQRIAYTGGETREIIPGDVVTGASSGATATVGEVVTSGGTWAGGNDAGDLELFGQVGVFEAEDLDTGGQANNCTVAADSVLTAIVGGTAENFTTRLNQSNAMFNVEGLFTQAMAAVNGFIHQFDPTLIVPAGTNIQIDYANSDDRIWTTQIVTRVL